MTILPDHEIEARSTQGRPEYRVPLIAPFDREQLQPASYDARIASQILIPHLRAGGPVDLRMPAENRTDPLDITEGYMLMQGRFVLGSTKEWVNIPADIVGRIEGKSSRARQGLQIHSAGYLDPGFCGNVTLEIVNFSPDPILVFPDVLIAQLSFEYMSSRARQPYSAKRNHYQNSQGVIESRAGH